MFAVMHLGLSPDVFWSLSVEEWRWLLLAASNGPDAVMTKTALEALIDLYPDKKL